MHRSATSRVVVPLTFLTVAAVIAPKAVGVAAGLGVIEPPASGASAEVIAQGLVTFDDGEFHWTLASLAVNRTLAPVGSESPGFLLAGGPVAVLVSSSDGAGWRLGPGEAVFRPEDSASGAMALAEGAAALTTISVDRGPGASAYIESERALLLVSSLAALLFWTIEVYWKTNQQAFGDRMWQIEHALALDQATGLKPFQIATTWGAERRKSR